MNIRTILYAVILVGIGVFSCRLAEAIDCTRAEMASECSYMEMLDEERNTSQPFPAPLITYEWYPNDVPNMEQMVIIVDPIRLEITTEQRKEIIDRLDELDQSVAGLFLVPDAVDVYITVKDLENEYATAELMFGRFEIALDRGWFHRTQSQRLSTLIHEFTHIKQYAHGYTMIGRCATIYREMQAYQEEATWTNMFQPSKEDIAEIYGKYIEFYGLYRQHCVGSK